MVDGGAVQQDEALGEGALRGATQDGTDEKLTNNALGALVMPFSAPRIAISSLPACTTLSFFWVLFWICIHFDGTKKDRVVSRFDK